MLAAKLLVIGGVVAVVAEVTAFASFFVGQAVLLAHGAKALPAGSSILTQVRSATIPYVSLSDGGALRAVFLSGIYLLLLSLLACATGSCCVTPQGPSPPSSGSSWSCRSS